MGVSLSYLDNLLLSTEKHGVISFLVVFKMCTCEH